MATATAPAKNGTSKFQPGFEPEQIALKFAAGKPVHSDFSGDQVLFTLTDNRRWYCDLHIAQKIEQMRIQPGEVFAVCKTETRRGNARLVDVEITAVVEPEKEPAADRLPTAGVHSHTGLNGSTPAGPAAPPVPPAPMNGHGETSADQMARCYRSAIDIVANAVLYAKAQGLVLAPCFEDVRCAAATLCINESGRR